MKIRVYWMSMALIALVTLGLSLRRSDAEASNTTTAALDAPAPGKSAAIPAEVHNLRVTLNVEDALVTQILNAVTKKDYGPFMEENYWGLGLPPAK